MSENSERIQQTTRGLADLRKTTGDWITVRTQSDRHKQYITQLGSLGGQIEFLIGKIECQLAGVSTAQETRAIYTQCRNIDRRLLWTRRLFSYFQSKFDQRTEPQYRPLLEAADEVVWSCYSQPYAATNAKETPAAPLPFIAAQYSPYAVPRDEPPQELRSDVDADFLAAMLQEIPIPVTGIPPVAVSEPWWLVYLAHEVGHHVQFDFEGGALLDCFFNILDAAGGSRWSGWNKELFADFYSLLMLGSWALWALAELVWSDAEGMLDDSNPRYPSPLVRLIFMGEVARKLELDASTALRGLTPEGVLGVDPVMFKGRDLRTAVKEDLKKVGDVAAAVAAAECPARRKLRDLGGFRPADFSPPKGRAYLWTKAYSGEGDLLPEKQLPSSRLALAGGVAAWAAALKMEEKPRAKRREDLRTLLPENISADRLELTREADEPPAAQLDDRNDRLAKLLLSDDIPGMRL